MLDYFAYTFVALFFLCGLWRGAIRELFYSVALACNLVICNLLLSFWHHRIDWAFGLAEKWHKPFWFLLVFFFFVLLTTVIDSSTQKTRKKLDWGKRALGGVLGSLRALTLLLLLLVPVGETKQPVNWVRKHVKASYSTKKLALVSQKLPLIKKTTIAQEAIKAISVP